MLTLAAAPDLSSVPAEFLKYFLITVGFFITGGVSAYVAYRKGRQANGTQDDPLNIAQPLHVKEVAIHADKSELDKLSEAVVALTSTVNSNHLDLRLGGSERESSIKELLRNEIAGVMREVSTFKASLNEDLTKIRERLSSAETRLDNVRTK